MPDPMYRRIAEDLQRRIESGDLRPGDQLPTELELREQYDASRNTIRDAVKWLTNRRLVDTRPGRGTFVVDKIDPFVVTLSSDPETGLGGGEGATLMSEATSKGRTARATAPRVEIQAASGDIAFELELEEGTQVISRHQQRFIDDTPWSLQTSFYPMELVVRGADKLIMATDINEGTVNYLKEQLDIEQAGYRDQIRVRVPSEGETTFFKLPEDGSVATIETYRTAYSADGRPFRCTISVFPADRNLFEINVGHVPPRIPPVKAE